MLCCGEVGAHSGSVGYPTQLQGRRQVPQSQRHFRYNDDDDTDGDSDDDTDGDSDDDDDDNSDDDDDDHS